MAKKSYKRLNFELSKEAAKSLERVVKNTDSSSNADAMRKALRFYEYICAKAKDGYNIELIKGEERVTIPAELV